jgi:hypothetical protein
MAGPNLPVTTDTTYPDSQTDPSVKTHQQHHDVIHAAVNRWDTAPPAVGQLAQFNGSTWVGVTPNYVVNMGGVARIWGRTAAQGLPTISESLDGDYALVDPT